jgi:hypothetical protein
MIKMLIADRFLSDPLHPMILTGYVLNVGSDSHIGGVRYFVLD